MAGGAHTISLVLLQYFKYTEFDLQLHFCTGSFYAELDTDSKEKNFIKNIIVLSCNVGGILWHYSLTPLIYSTAEHVTNKYYSVCLTLLFRAPSNEWGARPCQT